MGGLVDPGSALAHEGNGTSAPLADLYKRLVRVDRRSSAATRSDLEVRVRRARVARHAELGDHLALRHAARTADALRQVVVDVDRGLPADQEGFGIPGPGRTFGGLCDDNDRTS